MSIKKTLARVLVLAVLNFGAVAGVPIDIEEIEKLMNEMHQTRVELVVKQDDPPDHGPGGSTNTRRARSDCNTSPR